MQSTIETLSVNQTREALGILFQFLGEYKKVKIDAMMKVFMTIGNRAENYDLIGFSSNEAGKDKPIDMSNKILLKIRNKLTEYNILIYAGTGFNNSDHRKHNKYRIPSEVKQDIINLGKICFFLRKNKGLNKSFISLLKKKFKSNNFQLQDFVDIINNKISLILHSLKERLSGFGSMIKGLFKGERTRIFYNSLSFEGKEQLIYSLNNGGKINIYRKDKYHIYFYIGDFRVVFNKVGCKPGNLILIDYGVGFDMEHYFYNGGQYFKI